jgi:isoamylase
MPVSPRDRWLSREGSPHPLGVTFIAGEDAYNFALYSTHATAVTLLLYEADDVTHPAVTFAFDYLHNKSGRVWHCRLSSAQIKDIAYYAYSVDGPPPEGKFERHHFDPDKVLLDPYARQVFFPAGFDRAAAMRPGSNAGRAPLGVLAACRGDLDPPEISRPEHESDLVIYELHVRGFTQNPNSGVSPLTRGTYAGLIEKIPYLQDLGITAVELMPVFQQDPAGDDFWGYMPLAFFAPHAGYAREKGPREIQREFERMVEAFHGAGIEVLLDVVFNHTCEGDEGGPVYGFKGIDNSTYYVMTGNADKPYADFSGCGNTLHTSNRYVRRMILDSLHFWTREMKVDGFRFDLASVFTRNPDGSVNLKDPPIVGMISDDSHLAYRRLIAEPWDVAGGYELGGAFPGLTWLQWNDKFRDELRRFVRGDAGMVGAVMSRIYGSEDVFSDDLSEAFHAYQSVNLVTCHDGFTLYDLVSYNEKRNWANGYANTDGPAENYSWNCGFEGDDGLPPEVLALRKRQARNFCALLLLSNGTPMIRGGDEFLNSQGGNNNPYNQDNPTTWLDWSALERHRDVFGFFKRMIAFRKAHPSLCRSRFWREDVHWYGTDGQVDLSAESRAFAFFLSGASENDADLYVMLNMNDHPLDFRIQEGRTGEWVRVIDTGRESPDDIVEAGQAVPLESLNDSVGARSVVVFERR